VSGVVRFSVSVENELLKKFDRFCREEQFATRSEAVRQMIHETLTRRAWHTETREAAGTLTLVYDHHRAQLRDKLLKLQHDQAAYVVATLHVHLTHDVCLEVIALRGPAGHLQRIASQLRGLKGVHKGELVMATAQTD